MNENSAILHNFHSKNHDNKSFIDNFEENIKMRRVKCMISDRAFDWIRIYHNIGMSSILNK